MNSKEFSLKIEDIVKTKKDISYIDAVIYFCQQNDIDPGTVSNLISKSIKDKITVEAENLNYLPKSGRLPGL